MIMRMLPSLVERLDAARNRKLQFSALVFGGLLLLNVLFYIAAVRPGMANRAEQTTRIADLRKRYADGVLYQKQRKSIGAFFENIPTQKDMPLIVKELEQAARKQGLRVGSMNYDIPRPGVEGVAMLKFSFPVSGRYADLKRFVYEVETSTRLIGIEALDINAGKKGEEMTLKLLTYIKMENGGPQ